MPPENDPELVEEPSVLDFVKALLTPWRGPIPKIPPLNEEESDLAERPRRSTPAQPEAPERPQDDLIAQLARFPWRVIVPLVFAFWAQMGFEPSRRGQLAGNALFILIGFYVLAALWVLWSNRRGEWLLAPPPESQQRLDPLSYRRPALVAGAVLSLAAFFVLGGNLFTSLNVLLWLSALALMLYTFWLPDPDAEPLWPRLRAFFARPSWNLNVSPWALALLAGFALAAFFRFYRLAEVPPEMVSDHTEKLYDVWDILQGETRIFFPRNTGREPLQFYLIAGSMQLLGTGLSFLSMKIGTAFLGLISLVYVYLIGKEVGNKRVGLLALVLMGMAYWPNVQARIALRFILYPAFVAPVLYYLLRGIRSSNRNDYLLAGIFLGVGLHGYTPIRALPFVVLAAVGLYLLHKQSQGVRRQTLIALGLLALIALLVFLPLLRFAAENPALFNYRTLSRISSTERALDGPVWLIFLDNLWDALTMMNWDNGSIWPVSIPGRPALDIVSAVFFVFGVALLLMRYLRKRHWQHIFLLISVPLLMLPSILSLAFPDENPAPNRAGGAAVVVFVIAALALEGLRAGISQKIRGRWANAVAWGITLVLLGFSALHNFNLVFDQYYNQYRASAWNTSEMGEVLRQFADTVGTSEGAWVVAFPHWVDTCLVGINAGFPTRDTAIGPEALESTLDVPPPKMFLYKLEDENGISLLRELYPTGVDSIYDSVTDFKDFGMFFVPGGR